MTSGSSPVGLPRSHSPLHPPPAPPGSTGLTASIHVSLTGHLSQRAARVSAVQFSFTLFDKSMQIQIQTIFNSQRISVHDGDALAVLDVLCSGPPRGSRPPGRSTEDGELRRVQESMQRCSRAAARCLSLQGASIRVEDDFVQSGSFAFLFFFFI